MSAFLLSGMATILLQRCMKIDHHRFLLLHEQSTVEDKPGIYILHVTLIYGLAGVQKPPFPRCNPFYRKMLLCPSMLWLARHLQNTEKSMLPAHSCENVFVPLCGKAESVVRPAPHRLCRPDCRQLPRNIHSPSTIAIDMGHTEEGSCSRWGCSISCSRFLESMSWPTKKRISFSVYAAKEKVLTDIGWPSSPYIGSSCCRLLHCLYFHTTGNLRVELPVGGAFVVTVRGHRMHFSDAVLIEHQPI